MDSDINVTSVLFGNMFQLVYGDLQSSRKRVQELMKRSGKQQQQLPDLSPSEMGLLDFLVKRYINFMVREDELKVVEERETLEREDEQEDVHCNCIKNCGDCIICCFVNRSEDKEEEEQIVVDRRGEKKVEEQIVAVSEGVGEKEVVVDRRGEEVVEEQIVAVSGGVGEKEVVVDRRGEKKKEEEVVQEQIVGEKEVVVDRIGDEKKIIEKVVLVEDQGEIDEKEEKEENMVAVAVAVVEQIIVVSGGVREKEAVVDRRGDEKKIIEKVVEEVVVDRGGEKKKKKKNSRKATGSFIREGRTSPVLGKSNSTQGQHEKEEQEKNRLRETIDMNVSKLKRKLSFSKGCVDGQGTSSSSSLNKRELDSICCGKKKAKEGNIRKKKEEESVYGESFKKIFS